MTDQHISRILRRWYRIASGEELSDTEALGLAPRLRGHPLIARSASKVVSEYGVAHLETHPYQIMQIVRDVAGLLISEASLGEDALKLLEALSLLGVSVPAEVVANATGWESRVLQSAVDELVGAGLIELERGLSTHRIVRDYMWRGRLDKPGLAGRALDAATALWGYVGTLDPVSVDFTKLLPSVVRLYALGGDLEAGVRVRGDMFGAVGHAAVTIYDRRQYSMSKRYINYVLSHDPGDWRMRVYRVRIAIREEDWSLADSGIAELLQEQSSDRSVRRLAGWRQLRARNYRDALSAYEEIIADRPGYVIALREAAE